MNEEHVEKISYSGEDLVSKSSRFT